MSCLTESARPKLPLKTSLVYIETLNTFDVKVDGIPASWKSRTTGSNQLQHMVMYLVARCGTAVNKDDLGEIARRRSAKPLKHVVPAVIHLFTSWGMAEALVVNKRSITLQRHEVCATDTDELDRLRRQAIRLQAVGDNLPVVDVLERAAGLCKGKYMPGYDSLPEYDIADQIDKWQEIQKQILFAWAKLLAAQPEPRQCEDIMSAVARAVKVDQWNPLSCRIAADIARQCGNEERARYYEKRS